MASPLKSLIFGKNPRRTLIRAGILLAISFILFGYVLAPLKLEGGSMEPTYHSGQITVANRFAYVSKTPERGDVVAVRLRDAGRSIFLLKRIVGLPGESIGFLNGQLTVDGRVVEEHYLTYGSDWNRAPVLCEPNEFFVVGDNRSMPIDTHTLGRTTRSRIVGKVIF